MFRFSKTLALLVICGVVSTQTLIADEAVVNYEDHIKAIFREHCVSCHSASDKSSGLSLDNYGSALEGGSGGASLVASDSSASRLWRLVNHEEQPTMPPDQDKIDAKQLELLKTWIDQGMPENSGSQIKRKKVQVAAAVMGSNGRPEGPVPMPGDLYLETPRYTQKSAAISALAAPPWSPFVAVGGQSQVSLYHLETGKLLGVIPFPEGEPQSITFSRDGKLMLVGGGQHSKKGVAVLFDITTGKRLTTIGDEIDIVLAADISDDNSKVAIAGPQRIVRVYDIATGTLLHELKKHTDWIYALRFSPDGLLIASADRSNGMVIWETDTGRLYLDLIGHKGEIRSVAWRPDSLVLYSASMDNTVKMWDMNNGNIIKSWDAHGGGVTDIDVANDGVIATTGRDNLVKVWDGAGNAAGQFPNLAESGMEVAISVDSQFVIAGDWLGNVRMWKRANPQEERTLHANPPTLEMQIAAGTQQRDALVAERTRIQAEYDQLAQSHAQIQSANYSTVASLNQINQQVQAEQTAIAEAEPKVANMFGQLKQQIQAIDTKLGEQLEVSDKIAVIKSQQEALKNQIAALQVGGNEQDPNTKQESLKAADELNKQMEQLNASLDSTTIQYQEKQKEIQAAQAQIDTLRPALEQERNAVAVKKSVVERLTAQKAETDKSAQELAQRLSEATAKRDASRASLSKQSDLVAQSEAALNHLVNQVQLIEAERNQKFQNIQALEKKIEELNTGLAGVAGTKATQQAAIDQKSAEAAELQKQIDALLASKATIDTNKAQLEGTLAETTKQVAETESKIAEAKGELKSSTEEQERFNASYPKK